MAGSDLLKFVPKEQRLEHNNEFVNNMKRDVSTYKSHRHMFLGSVSIRF